MIQSDRPTILVIHRKYGVETIIRHSTTSRTGAKLLERRKKGSHVNQKVSDELKRQVVTPKKGGIKSRGAEKIRWPLKREEELKADELKRSGGHFKERRN